MKTKIMIICLLVMPIMLMAQHVYVPTDSKNQPVTIIDDFTIKLKKNCAYNEALSNLDEGRMGWSTPDNKFIFIYCYFKYEDDASQEERLIIEAAEMGIEVTGEGDIANMKLDNDRYLSFVFTDKMAIGVSKFYPDEKVGICFFVLTPEANDDGEQVFSTITSIRVKENQ